jgi:hypothetical protein
MMLMVTSGGGQPTRQPDASSAHIANPIAAAVVAAVPDAVTAAQGKDEEDDMGKMSRSLLPLPTSVSPWGMPAVVKGGAAATPQQAHPACSTAQQARPAPAAAPAQLSTLSELQALSEQLQPALHGAGLLPGELALGVATQQQAHQREEAISKQQPGLEDGAAAAQLYQQGAGSEEEHLGPCGAQLRAISGSRAADELDSCMSQQEQALRNEVCDSAAGQPGTQCVCCWLSVRIA